VQRLRIVHARLARTKASGQRQAGNVFVSLANRIPFALTAWATGMLMRLPQRGVVTVATNVPGPRRPLEVMGRRVLGVFPVSPLAMHLRTGVAMLSYAATCSSGSSPTTTWWPTPTSWPGESKPR
jgi:diacylglycerol O-acyltransferase